MKTGRIVTHRMSRAMLGGAVLVLLLTLTTGLRRPLAGEEIHIRVPVVASHIGEGLVFSGQTAECLDVHVEGDEAAIEGLRSAKPSYDLDLSRLGHGWHTHTVRKERVCLPSGVSIVAVMPAGIHFRLDEEVSKDLPVTVTGTGAPAAGYVVAEIAARPERVTIKGPKYILDRIQRVATLPVDLTGRSEPFRKETALELADHVRMMPGPAPVVAEITIKEAIAARTLPGVKVRGHEAAAAYQISPPTAAIAVKGPANTLWSLEGNREFNVFINMKDMQPGVYVRRAVIELPVGVTLIQVEPQIFTVTLFKP